MNSKFENWYLKTWGSKSEDTDKSNRSFHAWEQCKKEIIAIVEKNTNTNLLSAADYSKFRKMIEEIENL